MSQENLEFVRAVYASVDRGIDEELWQRFAPEFIFDLSRRLLESEVVRGRDEVRAYMGRVLEAWEEGYSNEPEELLDAGDKVVAFIRVSGTGKASGAQVDTRVAHVWTFRDGRPTSLEYFGDDRAAALEAAGLEPDTVK
jgi:hypothetical protein